MQTKASSEPRCQTHNKPITRLCTTKDCTKKCAKCEICDRELHMHDERADISLQYFYQFSKTQDPRLNTIRESHSQTKLCLSRIRADLIATIDLAIRSIVQNIEKRFSLEIRADDDLAAFASSVSSKTGDNLHREFTLLKESLEDKSNTKAVMETIACNLEASVSLSMLVERLKDTFDFMLYFSKVADKEKKLVEAGFADVEAVIAEFTPKPNKFTDKQVDPKPYLRPIRDFAAKVKGTSNPADQKAIIDKCNQVIAIAPYSMVGYFQKGFNLYDQKDYRGALTNYLICQKLHHQPDLVNNNKGMCFNSLKRFDEAIKAFDKALDYNPKYVGAILNKGVCYHDCRRYTESFACMKRVQQIDPDNTVAKEYKDKLETLIGKTIK